ncbi:bifunctional salicylyl-CoA 5-hydroxylase/oxidoreductase [Fodinicola acaciae]|uniref:bifunctional salicylyl-CoA 5-hydroxylase/oxidoreductase n=1 Tax=Fodinicola acaciae TaxID=2681555 RepID=UPI0013D3A3C9|nr:bifunctional salicylyl-CoA 5-hydroxylase/oxidoreductase [Fodinicola acaciae]
MRIAVVGGGPGGLYFSALVKQLGPRHEVTVWERNAPDDTFGFGVVLSDETLGGIEHADPAVFAEMQRHFARWDDIDVHLPGAPVTTSGGHGFAAMSRKKLLQILQERCRRLGVELRFREQAPEVGELSRSYDLVLGCDGVNSTVRATYADTFRPSVDHRRCRYMWLGTDLVFDAFTFHILQTPYGIMQIHGYPYDRTGSTFIIEMADRVWQRAGFTDVSLKPGESDLASIETVRQLCADILDGHRVFANNSKWLSFATVRNETWRHGNVVLLGDAAHTAHFSIGSGTKLAMEDALALAACLHENTDVQTALAAYEAERKPVVESTQRAAQASLEWFENIGQYAHQDREQFAFNILTRSRRVTYENLAMRDPEFVAGLDEWFARQAGGDLRPPMFQPFRLGRLELKNRVIVSAMDMYSAENGVPTDFHLVHLGSKALGGAALVMTEMVCVSPDGRITPGCTGLYAPEQENAWRRVVDFVHTSTDARIGVQLGHSGRKGSTRLMWEGIDQPLPDGNWDICGPSPLPYAPFSQRPRELTPAEMAQITADFEASALAAARAGFDLLELHCAHGYLLSSFISPLSNHRTDEYGGSLDARLRYPLEVFDAVRAAWPAERPMTVRISATDWHDGGIDADDAVEIARAFAEHGADGIDVSTGQVVSTEKPAFGRSYQTPYADRIRNEIGRKYGVAVIAVGAISSYDDVNSLLLAGRADLCALGRTHLYDPQWTLHAAVEQDYTGPAAAWPVQFAAGRRKPPSGRTDGPKPRLALVRDGAPATRHRRWRPKEG